MKIRNARINVVYEAEGPTIDKWMNEVRGSGIRAGVAKPGQRRRSFPVEERCEA
jgi:hypothetical protein